MLQFWFVCSLFGLFCCSDTNTLRPCITNAIGGSHPFPPSASPQEPMMVLPFHLPSLNCLSVHTALYQSGKPGRSSLSSLPLQAIFKPTRQVLWASPVFFIRLIAPPSHFRTNTTSAVSQSCNSSSDSSFINEYSGIKQFSMLLLMYLLIPPLPLVDKYPYPRPFCVFR